jgi:anti-anti-sigma regulatory factor
MAMNAAFLNMDEARVIPALREARKKLDSTEGEVGLDLSSVRRVGQDALKEIDELADAAEKKKVKIVLRGVNVEVYKVLKLVHLTRRLSFVN